ncbi:HNHc domain containing protein [uncultured Caudovirales phage]|uniref:HNHc domain containing protein n=1 Tax=uncultured Caudovirales phage TaxID=2100421 RepID=A0A6J5KRI0_9CAUD|nr:HNHc domain containing protein [uncultured Caudovirales phage]
MKVESVIRDKCGTEAGYKLHNRANPKEIVCQDCRDAHNVWRRDFHARNPDKNKQYGTKYRTENRELVRERGRKYYKPVPVDVKFEKRLVRIAKRAIKYEWLEAYPTPEYLAKKEATRLKNLEYGAVKRAQPGYKEALAASGKLYREKNKEAIQARARKRRLDNYEAFQKRQREYYEANKEHIRDMNKLWRAANPSKRREAERRSRARHFNVEYEYYTEQQVYELYGHTCYLCGTEIDMMATRIIGQPGWEQGYHLEHVVPLSRGGADTLDNVRPSHGVCNLRKGTLLLEEFDTPAIAL